jgi:hypothetical protein
MTRISSGWSVVWLSALLTLAPTASAGQTTFASPEDAADALLTAIKAGDGPLFLDIAGPQMAVYWTSDNPLRDSRERDRVIAQRNRHGTRLTGGEDRKVLQVGTMAEPFPAPLIRTGAGWRFDGEAGRAEIVARRIRRNETSAVELCRRIREAQFAFFASGNAFAAKVRSSPGRHDGLFWPEDEDGESPLGPVFAAAAFVEPAPPAERKPLSGYYFRILAAAENSRYGRFAVIAWPAEYSVGGIHSFIITQSGEVYRRDLGTDSARLAADMIGIHPNRAWNRIETASATATPFPASRK